MAMIRRMHSLGAALLIAAAASQGCAFFRPTGTTPTLVDRVVTKVEDGSQPTWKKDPSDQDVLNFTNDVKTVLRNRMGTKRMARLFSGTFQVLSAATAAALGATTGNLTAITALAGASAVTPEVQEIFDARAAAEAYRSGVEMVERAEGQYFERRAKRVARDKARDPNAVTQLVPDNTFTLDAAKLYRQVVASIRVVERTLVAQLPTIEDLRRAVGEINEAFDEIEDETRRLSVSATKVQLRTGQTAAVVVLTPDNLVTLVSSDHPAVATAAVADGARSITITPVGSGTAHVTMLTDKGMRASVEVKVRASEASDVTVMAPQTVTPGESFRFVVAGTSPAPKDIAKNALSVLVELRGVSGKALSFDATDPVPGWECQFGKQPAVTCNPANKIDAKTLAPHLRLTAKVPADYGQSPLRIVTEVASQGQLTLTENISVVPSHPLTLTVTPPAATLSTATATAYTVTVLNEVGPSEAAGLSLTLTVSGPAAVEAPSSANQGGWRNCVVASPAKTLTCKRDRLGVRAAEQATLTVPIKATGSGAVTINVDVKAASGPGASGTTTATAP
jgi:hypothetical protein